MPNKNPITIPAKVAIRNIMPPFVVLLIELHKKKRTTDESFLLNISLTPNVWLKSQTSVVSFLIGLPCLGIG